jgi:hypothetical protein
MPPALVAVCPRLTRWPAKRSRSSRAGDPRAGAGRTAADPPSFGNGRAASRAREDRFRHRGDGSMGRCGARHRLSAGRASPGVDNALEPSAFAPSHSGHCDPRTKARGKPSTSRRARPALQNADRRVTTADRDGESLEGRPQARPGTPQRFLLSASELNRIY